MAVEASMSESRVRSTTHHDDGDNNDGKISFWGNHTETTETKTVDVYTLGTFRDKIAKCRC
jgi:hypothetical protein